jgi:hypothetical protein
MLALVRFHGFWVVAALSLVVLASSCSSESQREDELGQTREGDVGETAEATPTDPNRAPERVQQPARARTTRERLSRDSSDLVFEQLPNGVTKVDLRGRFQQASVARIGRDGNIERNCVDTPEALDRWMQGSSGDAHSHPDPVTTPTP